MASRKKSRAAGCGCPSTAVSVKTKGRGRGFVCISKTPKKTVRMKGGVQLTYVTHPFVKAVGCSTARKSRSKKPKVWTGYGVMGR
jgi:uncharacterized protein GlcG (DUF336 family)